jgi:polysaccharide biosynthesis transport protein
MPPNQDFLNNKEIDPTASNPTPDTYMETQTKLLTSDTVAERVIKVLLPSASGIEKDGGIAKLRRWFNLTPPKPDSPESVVHKILGQIKVKPDGQSSLLSITAYGPTPDLTAQSANTLAEQYIVELQEARWNTATRTGTFLSRQLEELKAKLQASEDQLQDYARGVGLVYTSDISHQSVAEDKLRQIQQDLQKAEAVTADMQSQLELTRSTSADTLPKVLDDGSLRAAKDRLADLRRQLIVLRTMFTPNHYKVKAIESQIEELQAEMKGDRTTIVQRTQNEYRAAARRQALISEQYDKQLALVSRQASQEVRYNMLKREADANQIMYQSILQKVKEAGVLAALRASTIRIVDRAKPSSNPYAPNMVVNLGIGALAGCTFAVLFILLRERSDQSIRAPGESVKFIDVPELATIPSGRHDVQVQLLSSAVNRGRKGDTRKSSARSKPLSLPPAAGGSRSTDLWGQGESLVAESFRSAVTSILLWSRKKGRHRVIVVTSAHAKAGKTTSVFNLGLRLAESGRRVLLIDGDLRRPTLASIFGLDQALGLGDILANSFDPTVAKELIRETLFPGLFLLGSGLPRPNVAQLLHSNHLDSVLRELRPEFDFILIDSPPMIPMTDARLLGQHADGVVLICRAGQTSVDQLVSIRSSFYRDGTEVMGTILNDWDARSGDPSYAQSYNSYYKTAGST